MIHDSESNAFRKKLSISYYLFIITTWIIQLFLIDLFYICGLRDLDFWMLELIIVSVLMERMFNLKTYKHHKCGIYFNIIFCLIFKILSFLISFFFDNNDNDIDRKPYINNYWLIPIGIIIYIIIMVLRSYVNCGIKCLIDLQYISPFKLLLFFGIIGFLISSTITVVSNFIICETQEYLNICQVEINKTKYFENYEIYYKTLRGEINFDNSTNNNENTNAFDEIITEIGINIFGVISYFCAAVFYVLIIKYLTPVHIIFSNSIYYLIIQIIILIYNLIVNKDDIKKEKLFKLIIDIIEEFFSLFGFMVYLEIIELNFCGLNYDVRKNITDRSIADSNVDIHFEDDSGLLNEEEEYQEKQDSSFSSEKASKSSHSTNKENK